MRGMRFYESDCLEHIGFDFYCDIATSSSWRVQVFDHFEAMFDKDGNPHFRFHNLCHYCAVFQHVIGIPDAYCMQRRGWGQRWYFKTDLPSCHRN